MGIDIWTIGEQHIMNMQGTNKNNTAYSHKPDSYEQILLSAMRKMIPNARNANNAARTGRATQQHRAKRA